MQVKLRRYQNLLILSGLGTIAFGLWSIIKSFLVLITNKETLQEINDAAQGSTLAIVIAFIIVGVILGVPIGIRLIIGLSARSEGLGKKARRFYLVLTVIVFLADLAGLSLLDFTITETHSAADILVTLIVELTSLITLGEVIVSGVMVKRLNKQIRQSQPSGQAGKE